MVCILKWMDFCVMFVNYRTRNALSFLQVGEEFMKYWNKCIRNWWLFYEEMEVLHEEIFLDNFLAYVIAYLGSNASRISDSCTEMELNTK